MNNSTIIFDDANFISPTTRTLTCIFYLIFASCGLVVYTFDLVVFVKHRATFTNSFYILAGHCAIGDISWLLNFVLYAVPISWSNSFGFIGEEFGQIWANVDSVMFNTIRILLGAVALNRLMAILGNYYFISYIGYIILYYYYNIYKQKETIRIKL